MSEANYPVQAATEGPIKPSRAARHGLVVIYWPSSQNQRQKKQCLIKLWNLTAKLP
jgi:hypothetical protein